MQVETGNHFNPNQQAVFDSERVSLKTIMVYITLIKMIRQIRNLRNHHISSE